MKRLRGSSRRVVAFSVLLLTIIAWQLEAAGGQLSLTWVDTSLDGLGFAVERQTGTSGTFAEIARTGPAVTAYTDPSVADATTYCYRVGVFNATAYSDYSNIACGNTLWRDSSAALYTGLMDGTNIRFTWSAGSGVTEYWLSVGTTPGGRDLYDQSQGANLAGTVTGMPTNGETLYVRLSSLIGGVWQFKDYTYTASRGVVCAPAAKADLRAPGAGAILAGGTVTLAWSAGCQATEYWLDVGTMPAGIWINLLHQSQGANLAATVGGLPTDGQPVYVRLWSLIGGVWQFNDYTYTAAAPDAGGQVLSPAPGTTLGSSSATFGWSTGTGVAQYWLTVGSSVGGQDLYSQSQGTSLSHTVSGLPTDGRVLYVRLYSFINGAWPFKDYIYTAAGD